MSRDREDFTHLPDEEPIDIPARFPVKRCPGGIMPSFLSKASLAGALLALASFPALAEDPQGASVTLGLGAEIVPDYFGARTTRLGPAGALSIQNLVLPGGFGIGTASALPTDPGFGPRGAFRYIPSRDASDHSELDGLDDIDRAVELGAGLFHITERTRVYAEVLKGFGGHQGWVAEAGFDGILRPTAQLVLTAGPRANWGDTEFVDTYFGVTTDEATQSQFSSYSPGGGLVSLGIEVNARYDFRNGWGLHGTLGWQQLQGDAARSPITEEGNRDQLGARLLVTRSFGLGN
jgi:outer membrane scaffolding protein for murein synthesis (MipA/OmpV family)